MDDLPISTCSIMQAEKVSYFFKLEVIMKCKYRTNIWKKKRGSTIHSRKPIWSAFERLTRFTTLTRLTTLTRSELHLTCSCLWTFVACVDLQFRRDMSIKIKEVRQPWNQKWNNKISTKLSLSPPQIIGCLFPAD